jgi:hypothetical protein
MSLLAIDPGETNGWALLDKQGELVVNSHGPQLGQIRGEDNLDDFLLSLDPFPDVVVIEEYRVNPKYNHAMSKVHTIQAIGRIKSICRQKGIKAIELRTADKYVGYKFLKTKQPSNHKISHQFDALALGTFWAVKNGWKIL